MSITFQTSWEDYQAFSRAVKLSPWVVKGMVFLPMFLIPTVALLLSSAFYQSAKVLGWKTMMEIHGRSLLVQLLIFAIFLVISIGVEKAKLQRSPLLSASTTIVAGDESIKQSNGKMRDVLAWPRVCCIHETEAHFFVLRARKSGLIIPKRAFDSPAECAEFGAFIKRKWAQHHPDVAPIASPK